MVPLDVVEVAVAVPLVLVAAVVAVEAPVDVAPMDTAAQSHEPEKVLHAAGEHSALEVH